MSAAVVVLGAEELRALIRDELRAALAAHEQRASSAPPAEWLSTAAVAALLGVTPRQVAKLAQRGELPSVRVGRLLRFARADVDAYLSRAQ